MCGVYLVKGASGGTGGLLELFISLPLASSHRPFFLFDVFVFVVDVFAFDVFVFVVYVFVFDAFVFVFSFVVCAIGVAERKRRPFKVFISRAISSSVHSTTPTANQHRSFFSFFLSLSLMTPNFFPPDKQLPPPLCWEHPTLPSSLSPLSPGAQNVSLFCFVF